MINKDFIKIECNECSHFKEMNFSEYKKIKIRLRCGACGSKNFNSYMLSSQNDTKIKEPIKAKEPIRLKKRKRTASLLSKLNKSNSKKGDVLDKLWKSRKKKKKLVKKKKTVKKSVLKSNINSQTIIPEHVRKIALGDRVKNRFIKESDGSSRAGWMKDKNSRNS